MAYWMRFRGGWEKFLEGELRMEVHLELFEGADFTPTVHAYLGESSEVIYESHPDRG